MIKEPSVVVVDQRHALSGAVLGDLLDRRAEFGPLIRWQGRAVLQRHLVIAMDGVGGFADDADRAAHGLQQIQMRLDCRLLVRHRPGQQVQRMPARDEAQPVCRQGGAQCLPLWPFV